MYRNPIVFVIVTAAIVTLLGLADTAADRLVAKPTAIAVLSVADAYNALDEKVVVDAALATMGAQIKKEEETRVDELKQLQKDLEVLQPGGAAFRQKQERLQLLAFELKAWREFQQQRIVHEQALRKEQLYRKIMAAVGAFAEDIGYDLVLYQEREINFRGANSGQVDALIALRKVLWVKKELDITDAIVAKMNNDFVNVVEQ